MRNQHKEITFPFWVLLFVVVALVAIVPLRASKAAGDSPNATEGIAIGGSVKDSTINNTIVKGIPPENYQRSLRPRQKTGATSSRMISKPSGRLNDSTTSPRCNYARF